MLRELLPVVTSQGAVSNTSAEPTEPMSTYETEVSLNVNEMEPAVGV
jgi:hypothetical protein